MEKTFIQVLGLAGTVRILEYLKEHETASYKDLIQFGSVATLNRRNRQFSTFQKYVQALHCPTRWVIIRIIGVTKKVPMRSSTITKSR